VLEALEDFRVPKVLEVARERKVQRVQQASKEHKVQQELLGPRVLWVFKGSKVLIIHL
jgi:hypothetical protein